MTKIDRKLIKIVMDGRFLPLMILFMTNVKYSAADDVILNPYFHFPGASDVFMGMITTIAVPIEAGTPGEVLFSLIFEANYELPSNETEFRYPTIVGAGSSSARTFIYGIVKRKIEEYGYNGKECLLRTICEAAEYSTEGTGVLGDILHILLTPSTSRKEDNLREYEEAEEAGGEKKCKPYQTNCSFSLLDTFSRIGNIFENINSEPLSTNKLDTK
nr:uncharacterized protein LOC111517735 [Leptinotarsa decemlineata]